MKSVLCALFVGLMSVAFAYEDGSLTFCYSDNDGKRTIKSSSGATFTTYWSTCNKNKIYAYGYYVRLLGYGSSLTSFPTDPMKFVPLEWEISVTSFSTGSYAVFMNSQGQFLCARITNVKSKKYDGASADSLSITYRIYEDCDEVSKVILQNHELAKANYQTVGRDSGSVTYHYERGDDRGDFYVTGASGQYFHTHWTSRSDTTVSAYGYYVKGVAYPSTWTSFPSGTSSFGSLSWSDGVLYIPKGKFVVFQNSAGQYLVCKITGYKRNSANPADDYLSFDFRIYGTGTKLTPDPSDDTFPLTVSSSGTTSFDFTLSKMIGGVTTKWSNCGRDSLWAYRDNAKLIGVSSSLKAFPTTRKDLINLDWELRAATVAEGEYVVFLSSSGTYLCARIVSVQSKDWGAASNLLKIEYRVYSADSAVWDAVMKRYCDAQATYRTTGSSGTASFRYTCNGGRFTVIGDAGEKFVTMWSGCGASTIYAYCDGVVAVARGAAGWTAFPSGTSSFASLNWSSRVVTVREGGYVVFRNAAGGFLVAKVTDVQATDRGDTQDVVTFTYRIYAANSAVPAPATTDSAQVAVDISSTEPVTLPFASGADSVSLKLVKTVGSQEIDVSSSLSVARLADGSYDIANAQVRPEVIAETLDPSKGANLNLSQEAIVIETANTREGLVYEFHESTSLGGLSAQATETKIGDGKPFKPASKLTGAKSAFFQIKVTK